MFISNNVTCKKESPNTNKQYSPMSSHYNFIIIIIGCLLSNLFFQVKQIIPQLCLAPIFLVLSLQEYIQCMLLVNINVLQVMSKDED